MTLRELIEKVGEDALDYTLKMSVYVQMEPTNIYANDKVDHYDIGYSDKVITLS
mgnify:CR=1 FL=1